MHFSGLPAVSQDKDGYCRVPAQHTQFLRFLPASEQAQRLVQAAA